MNARERIAPNDFGSLVAAISQVDEQATEREVEKIVRAVKVNLKPRPAGRKTHAYRTF